VCSVTDGGTLPEERYALATNAAGNDAPCLDDQHSDAAVIQPLMHATERLSIFPRGKRRRVGGEKE